MNRIFDTKGAANYLGVSHRSLENWRQRGSGPTFTKLNKNVRYLEADLDAWLGENRHANTSATQSPLTALETTSRGASREGGGAVK